jgi:hypothetical protein
MVDALTPAGDSATPSPGDVTLCLYCGAIAFVVEELRLRPPTEEELEALHKDEDFRRMFVRISWARQHVMLRSHLLGFEAEQE